MKSIISITAIILVFSFCSENNALYTIEEKDGIRYIYNSAPQWGDEPAVSLELVRTYGGLDETDENLQFYRVRGTAQDKEGNLYILDSGNYRIQVFDDTGGFVRSIGRQGQGPGEFMSPRELEIDSQGNLYVLDNRLSMVIVLDNEGKELRRMKPEINIDHFRISPSGNIGMPMIETRDTTTPLVGLYDNDFRNMIRIGDKVDLGDEFKSQLANTASLAFDSHGSVYLSFIADNRLDKYTMNGELLWRSERPLPVEPGFRTMKFNARDAELLGIDEQEVPNMISTVINVDHKNRLWISTANKLTPLPGDDTGSSGDAAWVFHILNSDGIFLGSVPTKHDISACRIFGDRVYIVDNENAMVYEYRIVEK